MDQMKIGKFLGELRKGKSLTQEQLAEKLGVARRTVSRWETGNNLPDIALLIELSDFYAVDLREMLDGERRNRKMDKELEETVRKVAEYDHEGKQRITRVVLVYFSLGVVALIANFLMSMTEMPETFLVGFIKGGTFAMALCAMILGILYATGKLIKLHAFKTRMIRGKSSK